MINKGRGREAFIGPLKGVKELTSRSPQIQPVKPLVGCRLHEQQALKS
jgi:hypothetical protein